MRKLINKKSKKNIRRFFIVIVILFVAFLTIQDQNKISVNAASKYNSSSALKYANTHWNVKSYSIQCAEFVSNCLSAGGVSVHQQTCQGLRSTLLNKNYGTQYKLSTTTVGRYKRVKLSSNSNVLSSGDVILWRCTNPSCIKSKSGWRHAVLYSGLTKSGYICAYAHNNPHDKDDIMCASCYTCGSSKHTSVYVIHMKKASSASSSSSSSKNTSLKSFKSTFTVKTSNKKMYSMPYISSTVRGTLTNGSKVTVVGYLYNKNGNLWYKTNKGYYIACAYLDASSSKAPSDYMRKNYKVTAAKKSVLDIPCGINNGKYKALVKTTVKKGSTVKVIGKLKNSFGNTWYITSSGYYIWSGDLKALN